MTAAARLQIDWTRCDGHGLCHALAPDLLGRDEWGFPVPIDAPAAADGAPTTPRELRRLRVLVSTCPALALRLRTP